MDKKMFEHVLTLLAKIPDDRVIQQKSPKGENLFHVLSQNSTNCSFVHLDRIFIALQKRGVNFLERDNKGRTPLHYAVIGKNPHLVKLLLTGKANASELDNEGQSPMTLYLGNQGPITINLYNSTFNQYDMIFKQLVDHGADLNHVYCEKATKPRYSGENRHLLVNEDGYDDETYKTTILLKIIRDLSMNIDPPSHLRN